MENADSDEPEKKRPHLDPFSFPMARHSSTNSPDKSKPDKSKSVDAAVLQYQNQKLVQQLDMQKHELHDLEAKIKELQDNQTSYDKILIIVNQLWNQWVDDLILLGVRAGAGKSTLQVMDRADCIRGLVPSCPAEEIFLYKLLELDFSESSGSDGSLYIKEALASRHSATRELMKFLEDTIEAQRAKAECISQVLNGKPSAEGRGYLPHKTIIVL